MENQKTKRKTPIRKAYEVLAVENYRKKVADMSDDTLAGVVEADKPKQKGMSV